MADPCLPYRREKGRCDRCGDKLPGRRRRWCSDECDHAYWSNHMWQLARVERLKADGWTCQACGLVGWSEVPMSVLPNVASYPPDDRPSATAVDWAKAVGLLDPADVAVTRDTEWWQRYSAQTRMRDTAKAELPDSIHSLVAIEREARRDHHRRLVARRPGPGGHDLEVNHVHPRRGKGYTNGCAHHQDNLQTLCRRCHSLVTDAQRAARKRGESDTIDACALITAQAEQLVLT